MPFTTVDFIAFFAVVFFGYYAVPHRFRWMLLLAGSWVFYGWLSPYYLIFLGFTTVLTYLAAVMMDRDYLQERAWIAANGKSVGREEKKTFKAEMERKRWWWSCLAIVLLLSMLVVFKYLEFLFVNITLLAGAIGFNCRLPSLNLILPIGLSFYVFQSMAYVIDVQRGEIPAERNLLRHALYVSYFPQIMQGPIGSYSRLAPQLWAEHAFDYEQAKFGIQRVAWGFFKKLVIANRIAHYVNPAWGNVGDYSGFMVWFFISFMYAIQLYADFSGYMDIACGCSQMLGIKLDENFNCPYFSRTVPEFWRRWHMTLSDWFKNYLFYPVLRADWNTKLRKSISSKYLANVVPTSLALAIVWFATGLWHGASWGYVAWGVYYGTFMIAAIVMAPVYGRIHAIAPRFFESKMYSAFQISRTFIIVIVGYSIFKPADLSVTFEIWKRSVSACGFSDLVRWFNALGRVGTMTLVFCTVVLLFVDVIHCGGRSRSLRAWLARRSVIVRWGVYLGGLLVLAYCGMYAAEYQQFEYFKF